MKIFSFFFSFLFVSNCYTQDFHFNTINDSISVLLITEDDETTYLTGRYLKIEDDYFFSPIDSLSYFISDIKYCLNDNYSKDSIYIDLFIADPLEIGHFTLDSLYFNFDHLSYIKAELDETSSSHSIVFKPNKQSVLLSVFYFNSLYKKNIILFENQELNTENTNQIIIKCVSFISINTGLKKIKNKIPIKVLVDKDYYKVEILEFEHKLNKLTVEELKKMGKI